MTSSTYQRLTDYLLQKDQDMLRLSFQEIEDILGVALPPSAYEHRAWWANSLSHSHARHGWLKANYETAKVDVDGREVSFMRQPFMQGIQSIPVPGRIQYHRSVPTSQKGRPDLNEVVRRAGGVDNLAEITRAVQAYIDGDLL